MRRTTVRRTAVAASALSLALLVSACGGDKGADKPADKAADKPAAAEPAAKALSQAELDKLVLANGDLKHHKVAKPSKADLTIGKAATTDTADCEPLVDAVALRPVGAPSASSARKIATVPQKPDSAAKDASPEEKMEDGLAMFGSITLMSDTLGSYDGKGAQEALAQLRAAGEACTDGFTVTADSDKTKYTKVAPNTYTGGDEAVAFTLTMDVEGDPSTSEFVAVRKGNTLVSFYTMSFTGKTEQPKAVIEAQLAKLG